MIRQVTLTNTADMTSGRTMLLRPGQALTIGRTERADWAFPHDREMSGRHLAIECRAEACQIRDLDSTNGTFVNGKHVVATALRDGDEIQAGRTVFRVRVETADEPPAAALPGLPAVGAAPPAVTDEVAALSPTPAPETDEAEPETEQPEPLLAIANETPFAVAILLRENLQGQARLTVLVKATLAVSADGVVQIADPQLPVFTADQHYGDNPLATVRCESDLVPFKPRTDIVLVGRAYAPEGRPVDQVDVRLRVGRVQQTVRVFGNRRWRYPSALALLPDITAPEPFTTMDLVYERAFGGIDAAAAQYCAENLAGVGFVGAKTPASLHDKPLPNLEDPRDLIRTWDARPTPIGFGCYGRGWQPRLRFAGTYDERYRKERAPQLPLDFAYDFFNGAHPALQVAGYLRGDEDVELEHLTRDGYLHFQLPPWRPSVAVTRCRAAVRQTQPAPLIRATEPEPVRVVLDTLVLEPDAARLYLVFRGSCPLPSLEEIDITRIQVTGMPKTGPP